MDKPKDNPTHPAIADTFAFPRVIPNRDNSEGSVAVQDTGVKHILNKITEQNCRMDLGG